MFPGKQAFTQLNADGYCIGKVFSRSFSAHKVIWVYVHGRFPIGELDHIDRNRANNKLINLEEKSHSENLKNQGRYKNNSTGETGVCFNKRIQRFGASIQSDGKRHFLGYFDTIQLAALAVQEARVKYGFHPNHGT